MRERKRKEKERGKRKRVSTVEREGTSTGKPHNVILHFSSRIPIITFPLFFCLSLLLLPPHSFLLFPLSHVNPSRFSRCLSITLPPLPFPFLFLNLLLLLLLRLSFLRRFISHACLLLSLSPLRFPQPTEHITQLLNHPLLGLLLLLTLLKTPLLLLLPPFLRLSPLCLLLLLSPRHSQQPRRVKRIVGRGRGRGGGVAREAGRGGTKGTYDSTK